MTEVLEEPSLRGRVYVFRDRSHAGELLAEKLKNYGSREDVLVLAIPAGGVQVAFPIVRQLKISMDLAITRKLHVPWNREAGFGAITWDGTVLFNEPLFYGLGLTREQIERVVAEERDAIRRRMELFRGDKVFPDLREKVVILVDDGLASGFSMLATAKSVREKGAKEIVVAVPTASVNAIGLLRSSVDKIICLNIRTGPVFAVADAYRVWFDLEDEDVMEILSKLD